MTEDEGVKHMSIEMKHVNSLSHHVEQGRAWLAASAGGENTAAISYAALELRFAAERIVAHYWAMVRPGGLTANNIGELKRFDVNRIFREVGHQRQIQRHFLFWDIMARALQIDTAGRLPDFGRLDACWHRSSEYCHVLWPLTSADPETRKGAFKELSDVADELEPYSNPVGWPHIASGEIGALRDRFVQETATEDEVIAFLRATDLWARYVPHDGAPASRVGVAIPREDLPG